MTDRLAPLHYYVLPNLVINRRSSGRIFSEFVRVRVHGMKSGTVTLTEDKTRI